MEAETSQEESHPQDESESGGDATLEDFFGVIATPKAGRQLGQVVVAPTPPQVDLSSLPEEQPGVLGTPWGSPAVRRKWIAVSSGDPAVSSSDKRGNETLGEDPCAPEPPFGWPEHFDQWRQHPS